MNKTKWMLTLGAKVAIVGSKSITSREEVFTQLDLFFDAFGNPGEIISGGAEGIDSFAEEYAVSTDTNFRSILPDWKVYGKAAGFIRNSEIIEECDVLMAFWNGESKGTYDSINKALREGKSTFVFIIS